MTKDYLLYKNATRTEYATSIASSWAWTNDIFVGALFGYLYGLAGVICFSVINSFTFVVFGLISYYLISKNKKQAYCMIDSLPNFSFGIKVIFCCIALYRLVYSVLVQSIGFHEIVANYYPDAMKIATFSVIAIASLCFVWKYGIKGSIISDRWKYFLIIACGLVIVYQLLTSGDVKTESITYYDPKGFDVLLNSFLIVAIGQLCAPYVDQTLWQRALSMPKEKIVGTFSYAAILFLIIPVLFGVIGMLVKTYTNVDNWSIASLFHGPSGVFLSLALIGIILSTLDSDLCGIHGLYAGVTQNTEDKTKYTMVGLLVVACFVFCVCQTSLFQLQLFSGSTRAVVFVPVLLYLFNCYDATRLFWSLIVGLIVSVGGYSWCEIQGNDFGYIFTTAGVFIPLLGFKTKCQAE